MMSVKLKTGIQYGIIALFFFLVGLILSPGSTPRKKIEKKLSYSRGRAQRLYNKWNTDELKFLQTGETFSSFANENDLFILYFYATWCPHCENIASAMNELSLSAIPFAAIPFDTDKAVFETETAKNPHYWRDIVRNSKENDWDFLERSGTYNVPLIPSVWILQRGKVVKIFIGEKGCAVQLPEFLKNL